ncbi:YdhH/YoaO family protein [Bacillus haynesii]|uniref:DUF4944 domain-containing protein n=1 Tax=Bacillus haynesii TaxID=1925021 RepID=UPI0022811DF5|nr:DUF4944 domain-containing protein [Bacillus haynesii]MCY8351025.1 YdhH/YoaO family protein [Bacillus haynesii]
MKQEYKRPVLFIASLLIAFCAVYFGGRLIGFFPGGGSKEQSVSFLEGLEEAEFAGRKVTVQLDWREGKQASHTAFTLDKSSW